MFSETVSLKMSPLVTLMTLKLRVYMKRFNVTVSRDQWLRLDQGEVNLFKSKGSQILFTPVKLSVKKIRCFKFEGALHKKRS
jgi:hypothetical protein